MRDFREPEERVFPEEVVVGRWWYGMVVIARRCT
jgi:hypothetical protein